MFSYTLQLCPLQAFCCIQTHAAPGVTGTVERLVTVMVRPQQLFDKRGEKSGGEHQSGVSGAHGWMKGFIIRSRT